MRIRCWLGFHKWYRVGGHIWWFDAHPYRYKSCTNCDHDHYAE